MRFFTTYLLILFFTGIWCMNDEQVKSAEKNEQYDYLSLRQKMVDRQIKARGIKDSLVLKAMQMVPRHLFVPKSERKNAYDDNPLPIGYDQTISQPYIVAFMTEMLSLDGDEKVLEIGTGSGYQAAVLGEIVKMVCTIEIVPELCQKADVILSEQGYSNIKAKCGDGYEGWPEFAPFDAIMLTAAPTKIPQPLVDQLKIGGRMILPIGKFYQELILLKKQPNGQLKKEKLIPVRFVPMTGKIQKK